jgi:hypothetical protein
MQLSFKGRPKTRLFFLGGILLMYLGCAFLLAAFARASRLSIIVASAFIIAGSLFAFLAVAMNKRSVYLFLAAFCILIGFFLFISSLSVVPIMLRDWWPVASIFAGLAMIPAGWHHYGIIKPRYVVPSVIFIILGVALLFFSLGIVDFSFKQFLIRWWPLLFVMAGLILMLIALGTKLLPEDTGRAH